MSGRLIARSAVLFVSLVVLGMLLKTTDLGSLLDTAWIDADIKGQGAAGKALFVAAGAAFVAVGLPRQAVAFLGGYAFGLVEGSALALMAQAIGCATAFVYARFIARDWVAKRISDRMRRIDAFLASNTFAMTLLIRFLPVGNNLMVNLTAGVSGAGALAFIGGSALGYIPQTVIFALVGSGIDIDPLFRIGLAVVLFAASGVMGIWLYRRHRHGRHLDEALEREIGVAEDDADAAADAAADVAAEATEARPETVTER